MVSKQDRSTPHTHGDTRDTEPGLLLDFLESQVPDVCFRRSQHSTLASSPAVTQHETRYGPGHLKGMAYI